MSGNPVPGTFAEDGEVVNIAKAVHDAGGGMMEIVSGFLMDTTLTGALKERTLFEAIAAAGDRMSDVPVVFNIHPFTEEWNTDTLAWLSACREQGMQIYGCTSVKAIATLWSMESNINPLMNASPTYHDLSMLPSREERLRTLADPSIKATVLAECAQAREEKRWRGGGSGYPMIDAPDTAEDYATYEPLEEHAVKHRAKALKMADASYSGDPIEYIYDHFLTRDGRGTLYMPGIGFGVNTAYRKNDLEGMREMMVLSPLISYSYMYRILRH